jgi:hypothetical protein
MRLRPTFLFLAVAVSTALAQTTLQTPSTESIDVDVRVPVAGSVVDCRLAGQVTLWASRLVRLVDDARRDLGGIEAGLGQFGAGTRLEGCGLDGVDVSNRFVNFVLADGSAKQPPNIASRLAQDSVHLAEQDGTRIPLVGQATGVIAPDADRLTILLIRHAHPGSFDAVVQVDGQSAESRSARR